MNEPIPSSCKAVEGLIPLYVGEDDLDREAMRVVREHLAECAGCARAAEAAARARGALLALDGPSASDEADLWEPIQAALASEGRIGAARVARPGPDRRRTASLARWLPASAAAAALVAIALEIGGRDDGAAVQPRVPDTTAPVVAVDGTGELPPLPFAGGLRRAFPGEERLRDTAQLFPAGFAPEPAHGVQPASGMAPVRRGARPAVTPVGWSLAGQQ